MGMVQAGKLKKRVETLRELQKLLTCLKIEIGFSPRDIGEMLAANQDLVLCRLAAADPVFEANPNKALKAAGAQVFTTQGDRQLFTEFVQGLGGSDIQGQLTHIAFYTEKVHQCLKQAMERQQSQGKLYTVMGLFGGMTAGLLLM